MSHVSTIDAPALRNWREAGQEFHLVDVLPPEYHLAKRIPGAANACVFETAFLESMGRIAPDKGRPVVVHGSSEKSQASRWAADLLVENGYTDVHDFRGGLVAWEQAGYAVEGDDPALWDRGDRAFLPADGTFEADPDSSVCEWTGRNLNGKHCGTLAVASGSLTIAGGLPAGGGATFDMTRMTCGDLQDKAANRWLIAHLQSRDFFDTARHPLARLVITGAVAVPGAIRGCSNYSIMADVTICGVTRSLVLPVTLARKPDGQISLEAHFDLDRTRWGVNYGSGMIFELLGKHLVDDLISLEVRIHGR